MLMNNFCEYLTQTLATVPVTGELAYILALTLTAVFPHLHSVFWCIVTQMATALLLH